MSSSTKNCPAPKKQTRAKPATPPPVPIPVFTKIPCPRDQQAYGLYLEKHTQRWIAGKLKCTQPTVLRGIRRMEKWLATTLPEDRGEYTATEKLRLALAKHERLMERLLKMSLREFRRSRKTIPMKKTITMKEGKDEQGEPVKIRIEEWNKHQIGRKGFIDSAAKTSHEITVLAAGWLGAGSGTISMAEVMDPEERDRWDRMVKIQDARIKELEQRVVAPAAPVSKVAENNPIVYQEAVREVDATSSGEGACVPAPDASAPKIDYPQYLYQEHSLLGTAPVSEPAASPVLGEGLPVASVLGEGLPIPHAALTEGLPAAKGGDLRSGVSAGSETRAEPVGTRAEQSQFRGEDEYRQEALDYHCLQHGLKPASIAQATGIPDPKSMSPRMWIERGYPYQIYIDWSVKCTRKNPLDTGAAITLHWPTVIGKSF